MKYHVIQSYLETFVRDAVNSGKQNVVYPESLLYSTDFSKLIKLGFTYDAEKKILSYPIGEDKGENLLSKIASSDLLTEFTDKDIKTIESLNLDPNQVEDTEDELDPEESQILSETPVQNKEEEEVVDTEKLSTSMQELASSIAKQIDSSRVLVPSPAPIPGTTTGVAVNFSQDEIIRDLEEKNRQVIVGLRRQSLRKVLKDAEERGVSANALRLGKDILENLIGRVEPVSSAIKLSVDDQTMQEGVDTFQAVMYLFESIPGVVPVDNKVSPDDSPEPAKSKRHSEEENNLSKFVREFMSEKNLHAYERKNS